MGEYIDDVVSMVIDSTPEELPETRLYIAKMLEYYFILGKVAGAKELS